MPRLTIKTIYTQETDNGTEIYIDEAPAFAAEGIAMALPSHHHTSHLIGCFNEATANRISYQIMARYPADVPSEDLTPENIQSLKQMASASVA